MMTKPPPLVEAFGWAALALNSMILCHRTEKRLTYHTAEQLEAFAADAEEHMTRAYKAGSAGTFEHAIMWKSAVDKLKGRLARGATAGEIPATVAAELTDLASELFVKADAMIRSNGGR